MPGPKYDYLNVREDLRIGDGSTRKGMISVYDRDLNISSSTDGTLNINADTIAKITAPTTELEASAGITLDGDVTIDGSHSLTTGTGTLSVAGDLSVTGDLVRRYAHYISAASTWTLPTGYTRLTQWAAIPDEGIIVLDCVSGNLYPKLPSTPVIGRTITLILNKSGAIAQSAFSAKISSNRFKLASAKQATNPEGGTYYYATLYKPGQVATITNDGQYYYVPSGTVMPTLSAT